MIIEQVFPAARVFLHALLCVRAPYLRNWASASLKEDFRINGLAFQALASKSDMPTCLPNLLRTI